MRYWSDAPASIDAQARVVGTIARASLPKASKLSLEKVVGAAAGLSLLWIIVNFVSTLVVGLLLVHFYPQAVRLAVSTIRHRP